MSTPIFRRAAATMLSLLVTAVPLAAFAQADTDDPGGTLSLGGQVILRLRSTAGGLAPEQRIGVIMNRIDRVVGVPFLKPSDVVVYVPPKAKTGNQAPVIYALGRRLITVDAATVQAAGGGKPLTLAETWAKRLQQILPRIDWRPSNAPDNVVPPNPPLLVTSDITKVGGDVGDVKLRDHLVIRLRGPQADGMTAAERADALTSRVDRAADALNLSDPNAVTAAPHDPADPKGAADLSMGTTLILTVSPAEAKADGMADPLALAQSWAKNIRGVLGIATPAPTAPATPAPATPAPVVPATPAPTTPAPAVPAPAAPTMPAPARDG